MWNRIALTPSEAFVLKALQFLDPDIERIAVQASSLRYFGSYNKRWPLDTGVQQCQDSLIRPCQVQEESHRQS